MFPNFRNFLTGNFVPFDFPVEISGIFRLNGSHFGNSPSCITFLPPLKFKAPWKFPNRNTHSGVEKSKSIGCKIYKLLDFLYNNMQNMNTLTSRCCRVGSRVKPTSVISHFRVTFYPCFKTSPGAQPFTWKWVWSARQETCKKNLFPFERLCTKTRFETEVRATRKWPIKITVCERFCLKPAVQGQVPTNS